jgi:hypothetical protein
MSAWKKIGWMTGAPTCTCAPLLNGCHVDPDTILRDRRRHVAWTRNGRVRPGGVLARTVVEVGREASRLGPRGAIGPGAHVRVGALVFTQFFPSV